MYRIFISYRRSDSESFSGRLRDRLRTEFGTRAVFMDTSTITGGARFDEAIAQNLKTCTVFIAVIGRQWLDCQDDAGQRRLDDPGDWVRKEVAQALLRDDLLVVPVIFGGAKMPRSEDLPPELESLARRNAVSINDADFDSDVTRLIEACEPLVPRPRRWPWVAGAAAALLAGVGGWLWHDSKAPDFRGVYLVPGAGVAGSLPEMPGAARKKKYYLSLSSEGKRFDIEELTLRSVLIVSEDGLDAPASAQDIAALKSAITGHFKANDSEIPEAGAASLSADPVEITSSQLKVSPGARISAEYGSSVRGDTGQIVRTTLARCEFLVPRDAPAPGPVFYVTMASDECRAAG